MLTWKLLGSLWPIFTRIPVAPIKVFLATQGFDATSVRFSVNPVGDDRFGPSLYSLTSAVCKVTQKK